MALNANGITTLPPDSAEIARLEEQGVSLHAAGLDSLTLKANANNQGMVMVNPSPLHDARQHVSPASANSWVILLLFALFAAACFRYRNNIKYFQNLLRDLTDVRERGNVFDDTVRETSFATLLNALCAASGGVLLYVNFLDNGLTSISPLMASACSFLACAIYCVAMPVIYWMVGNIFTDASHAKIWMQGFVASQAILGVALFPIALVTLFYPGARGILFALAGILIIIAKILFITKGFRIFFTKYSSWVTFLYYLCSLEIVPLILTYVAARQLTIFMA